MTLTRPLSELNDAELLNLLDEVSGEVKKRNSLSMNPEDEEDREALKRATEAFAEVIRSAVTGPGRT